MQITSTGNFLKDDFKQCLLDGKDNQLGDTMKGNRVHRYN